ncbi:MAG TPA: ribulose-phosphate 3-epimerase [bacterium]|nr:ribulose-phosphate 3-epimerase [bacterium]
MLDYRICPSILAGDFMHMGDAIEQLVGAGCSHLHMDIMDGHFVPQLTFGEKIIADARAMFSGTIDSHLMVSNPGDQIKAIAAAGSDIIIIHAETAGAPVLLNQLLDQIRQAGALPGIALDGPTQDLSVILPIVDQLAVVLVATGKVGKAGQKLDHACLDKVRQIREMPGTDALNIMVDIGINAQTLPEAKAAGANWFVASSAIFNHPQGIAAGYAQLVAGMH